MIRIQQVTRRFGDQTILDHLSLDFEERHVHALIAPNGSGKTTLLGIIADILAPNEGRVIDTHTRRKPNTTILLSGENNLFMKNTVRENLRYLAAIQGVSAREAHDIVQELIRLAPVVRGLDGRKVEELSYGQKRMVAIASAAVSKSSCLIVDEAAEGLDIDNVQALVALLRFVARHQTVIIASHDLHFCFEAADSFHFLAHGKVTTVAKPASYEQLVDEYESLFAAKGGATHEGHH